MTGTIGLRFKRDNRPFGVMSAAIDVMMVGVEVVMLTVVATVMLLRVVMVWCVEMVQMGLGPSSLAIETGRCPAAHGAMGIDPTG